MTVPTPTDKVRCPACDRDIRTTDDGRFYAHWLDPHTTRGRDRCMNSRQPTEICPAFDPPTARTCDLAIGTHRRYHWSRSAGNWSTS